MFPGRFVSVVACCLVLLAGCATRPAKPHGAGPWNVAALGRVPECSWGPVTDRVQELYYEGEPAGGKPTRVFAYLGRPDPAKWGRKRLPGMILVHGGGGKAFKDWADHWARRGYVALAMDLSGNGPHGKLPDGGPDQDDRVKFREFAAGDVPEMWTYHAVAAVIRGHSLLRSLPEVDPDRTGLTGISWGGYLSCIVAGLDHRFKVAVPVYGCGYLGDNSVWTTTSLAAMKPESRALWLDRFDPSRYLGGVSCPVLFLNGTTDFAYPLDSYRKSYRLVPARYRHLSIQIGLPHGHIWTFPEVDAFVDGVVRGGKPLPAVGETRIEGDRAEARVNPSTGLKDAVLCYTTDAGPWQKRAWKTVPALIEGPKISAGLPTGRPLVGFVSVTDARGLRVSGEHFELDR